MYFPFCYSVVGVSIIYPIRQVNPIRFEPDPIRHDPKINGSGKSLIFFDMNRVGLGSGQPDPTRLIIFFEVIL
jgi:hypothetical protein